MTLNLASPYTKIFYIEYQLDPLRSDYNIVFDQTIVGDINIIRLEQALTRLVEDHILLNSHLSFYDDELYWEKNSTIYPLTVYENNLNQEAFVKSSFNLEQGPLYRFALFKNKEEAYDLIIVLHHVLIDGSSMDEFVGLVSSYYKDENFSIDTSLQYEAILQCNKSLTQKCNAVVELAEQCSDHPVFMQYQKCAAQNSLPVINTGMKKSIKELCFNISNSKWDALQQSIGARANHFLVFQLIWGVLIHRHSNQEYTHISYPVRIKEGADFKYGAHINTMIYPLHVNKDDTFLSIYQSALDFVGKLKFSNGSKLNYLPIYDLLKRIPIEKFNATFCQTNFKNKKFIFSDCCVHINNRYNIDIAGSHLSLGYELNEDGFSFKLFYREDLFHLTQVEEVVKEYQLFLDYIIATPRAKLKEHPLVSNKVYEQMFHVWNQTDRAYPKDKVIHGLFEEQAERRPDNVALVFNEHELTYKELNEKSNQLARYIRKEYKNHTNEMLGPDVLIVLCLDKSIEMIIGILAILKAGGAYVSIDPSYPDDRISHILKDSGGKILLTQAHLRKKLETILSEIRQVEEEEAQLIALDDMVYTNESSGNLALEYRALDLAYVIYTSGTTGKPKGAMLNHRGLVNLVFDQKSRLGIDEQSRVLQFASLVFDASVSEIFCALSFGARLYILDEASRYQSEVISACLINNKITFAILPPAILGVIADGPYNSLKTLVVGGESCPQHTINKWVSGRSLVNGYGPTECTVFTTMHFYQEGDANNIGKPLSNAKVYILDSNLLPVPVGVAGELYIGGAGLARGYLNQPELTKERFIVNPFATESDKKLGYTVMYKTGDLVRWLPDGNIEYIGRNDFQVKIRGIRVELGEIENILSGCAGIKQVSVQAKTRKMFDESGGENILNKYLLAYYVSEQKIDDEVLIARLMKKLPEYMIPRDFIWLESFPLTVNGKLDSKALPDSEFSNVKERGYMPPQTELEHQLCKIWVALLGLDQIGIQDDFFRIGGDSILSIQLTSRLRAKNLHCSVKDIFDHRTIARLAKCLTEKEEQVISNAEQGILVGGFNLLPIQTWFFDQVKSDIFSSYQHWNQSFLIKVPELDVDRLEHAIEKLVTQHDALRLQFPTWKKNLQQCYLKKINIPKLKIMNVSHYSQIEIHNRLTQWQSDFNIEKGPMWSVGYLHGYADGTARVYFALHHLIIDAVSWRIIVEDLKTLYEGRKLTDKSTSYRQWVEGFSAYAEKHSQEIACWERQLVSLPDYKQYLPSVIQQESQRFSLTSEMTQKLLTQANRAYHTEINDLLLVALAYTLQHWQGSNIQGITLEGHGREHLDETVDLSRTVGWFTSLYPVKLELKENLSESIKHIKEALRSIPNKGIGYGALHVQGGEFLKEAVLPPISFNYLGQFDNKNNSWCLAFENSGTVTASNNSDTNIININGMITGGKLTFILVTKLGKRITSTLATTFKTQLEEVISHCIENIERKDEVYTPSDFETVRISQGLLGRLQLAAKERGTEIEAIYPANSLQEGFIYHVLTQPDDDAYRIQTLFDYQQALNIKNYRKAWELAVETYPMLRTAFDWEEELIQVVYKHGILEYKYHDISQLRDKDQKEKAIREIQEKTRRDGFDLRKTPLLKVHVLKQSDEHYTILKNEHHSISDGWSCPIVLNKVHAYYQALQLNQKVEICADDTYLAAQKYCYKHGEKIEKYWQETVSKMKHSNDLNPLLSKQVNLDDIKRLNRAEEVGLELSGHSYDRLKRLLEEQGLTMNVLLQFAWHKLIQTYTQDAMTIVGTTVSGRDLPISGIEESVGLYINTLPLMVDWHNELTVREQLQNIHQGITSLNRYSFAYLSKLQPRGQRLFHSLFVFENYPLPEKDADEANLTAIMRQIIEKLDYPLGCIAYDVGNKLHVQLKYDEEILTKERACEHLSKLKLILEALPGKINDPHHSISLLTKNEHQQIMCEWNQADKDCCIEGTFQQLFQKQVEQTPGYIAVNHDGQEFSYQELNEAAEQLAARLIERGLMHQGIVAFYMDRGIDHLISMLAVWKCGGVFVPLNPSHPHERNQAVLSEISLFLLLTTGSYQESASQFVKGSQILVVDDSTAIASQSWEQLCLSLAVLRPEDTAYIIFTSGSTGAPKGAMVRHNGMLNHLYAKIHDFDINETSRIAQTSTQTFDVSIWQYFAVLLVGGQTVIFNDEEAWNPSVLLPLLEERRITIFESVPSHFAVLLEALAVEPRQYSFPCLQRLMMNGEALPLAYCQHWFELYPKISMANVYGPTECSDDVTHYCFNSVDDLEGAYVPIGGPVQNTRLYVLGNALELLPTGVPGELYVSGICVGQGYVGLPDKTATNFIANPYAADDVDHQIMYKTGDLVRWLPDGVLEYLGRDDFQVKIRGQRVELGEIESQLLSHEAIHQCVVTVLGSENNLLLAAYYVVDKNIEFSEFELRDYLLSRLPSYMVPGFLVCLAEMPLTASGKIDRRALPVVDVEKANLRKAYVAPRNEMEALLASIWVEVLDLERASIFDNFFELGGHSLNAMKAIVRINRMFKITCPIITIFENQTIEKLAIHVEMLTNYFSSDVSEFIGEENEL